MTGQLTESSAFIENLRQVVHDVRQPLSGIENVAFMLEMASSVDDPKTLARLEHLRHLVDQTNWILEDALRASQVLEARSTSQDLCQILRAFAARTSLREDRSLSLRLPQQAVIVSLDRDLMERILHWVVQFSLTVAQSTDSAEIRCAETCGRVRVTLTLTPGGRDLSMMAELLDPRTRTGYLRCLANALGAALEVGDSGSGALLVALDYPPA